MQLKFYKCDICHKVIVVTTYPTGIDTICCNQPMHELIPNTSDGAQEKHVPVIQTSNDQIMVSIGSQVHPMEEKHYIEWIGIETNLGWQIKYLKPHDQPLARFRLADQEQLRFAYAYCNVHGLWRK